MGGYTQSTWTPTKRRGPVGAEFNGPGPASVSLPALLGNNSKSDSTRTTAAAYSFGNKPKDKAEALGPGPGQYNVTKLSYKGKDESPAPTLHGRPKDPTVYVTPAPGAYSPEKSEKIVLDTSPSYTFGIKGEDSKPQNSPAPNSYNIAPLLCSSNVSGKVQAPIFSISGRGKSALDDVKLTPGPGAYETGNPDSYKSKSPSYTLSNRYQLPSDSTMKPGPGAHSPEKCQLDVTPGRTFGIKHSVYTGELKGDKF